MKNITISEHQKLYFSSKGGQKNIISKQDAMYLQQLEEHQDRKIFSWGRNYVSPQQWVGIVSTPYTNIEILPKIAEEMEEERVRKIFINMLLLAYDIPVRGNIESAFQKGSNGFLDILVSIFLTLLGKELRKGIALSYVKNRRNTSKIKGSINFSKQLNKNIFLYNKFVCDYSMLTVNNRLNKIIKFCLLSIIELPISQKNKNSAKRMLSYFDDVEVVNIQKSDFAKLFFDRRTKGYKEIIEYCRLFYDQKRLQLKSGDIKISFLLFDMNKLFEMFIFKVLKRIFGTKVKYQYATQYLVTSVHNKTKRILLKPDILYHDDSYGKFVIDTKWKIVKTFASENDIYQMHSYLSALENIKEGILLYPKSVNNDKMVGDYLIKSNAQNLLLKIRTVDLTLAGDLPAFFIHLRHIIGR